MKQVVTEVMIMKSVEEKNMEIKTVMNQDKQEEKEMAQKIEEVNNMEEKGSSYEEIQGYLSKVTANPYQISIINALFEACQKYNWRYEIREHMEMAERILQSYFDESDYIAQRKINLNKVPKPRFSLSDKLYLEFLGRIYDEYYKDKMGFEDLINQEDLSECVSNCFRETPPHLLDALSGVMDYAKENSELSDYVYERHDYSSLHEAISGARAALEIPAPPKGLSVEKVIAPNWLEGIADSLKSNNIAYAVFAAAKMTRSLTDGKFRAKTHDREDGYFNLKSEYNLKELEKRIQAIRNLVKEYDDIMEELDGYCQISK